METKVAPGATRWQSMSPAGLRPPAQTQAPEQDHYEASQASEPIVGKTTLALTFGALALVGLTGCTGQLGPAPQGQVQTHQPQTTQKTDLKGAMAAQQAPVQAAPVQAETPRAPETDKERELRLEKEKLDLERQKLELQQKQLEMMQKQTAAAEKMAEAQKRQADAIKQEQTIRNIQRGAEAGRILGGALRQGIDGILR